MNARKPKTARQCVVCGFPSVSGTRYSKHKFVCRGCESDQIEENEQRWEEETYLELLRIEQDVTRYTMY